MTTTADLELAYDTHRCVEMLSGKVDHDLICQLRNTPFPRSGMAADYIARREGRTISIQRVRPRMQLWRRSSWTPVRSVDPACDGYGSLTVTYWDGESETVPANMWLTLKVKKREPVQ